MTHCGNEKSRTALTAIQVRVVGVRSCGGGLLPYAVLEKTTPGRDIALSDVDNSVRRIGPDYCITGAACLQ